VVNNASDLIYLQALGDLTLIEHAVRMDPRWVVIPVGGVENLPTFISLLGENYVSVAVMMEITPTNKKTIERINSGKSISGMNPVKWVEVTRIRDADIEDLFNPNLYLEIVNKAYSAELNEPLTMKIISDSNPRIAERVALYFERHNITKNGFNRYVPAAYLLEHFDSWKDKIGSDTVEKITALITRINGLLPTTKVPLSLVPESSYSDGIGLTNSVSINQDSPVGISEYLEESELPVQTQF
jgi:hypothetical protein